MLAESQLDEVRSSRYQGDCFTAAKVGAESGASLLEGETPELLDANFGIGGNWKGFREGALTKWVNEEKITETEYLLMAEKQANLTTVKNINENMVDYIVDSILEGLPVLIGVNRTEYKESAGKVVGFPGVANNNDGTYRKINEGVTNHWLVATGFKVNSEGMVDEVYGIDNVGGVDVTFKVDPVSRELNKPIEDWQSQSYPKRSGYQVTQLRLWREVEPTMKTTGAGIWMQKDIWK